MNSRLGAICLWALALGCVLGPSPSSAQGPPPLEWRYLRRTPDPERSLLLREAADGGWVVAYQAKGSPRVVKVSGAGRHLWDYRADGTAVVGSPAALEALPNNTLFFLAKAALTSIGVTRLTPDGRQIDRSFWPVTSERPGSADTPKLMHRDPTGAFLFANHHYASGTGQADVCLSQFHADGTLAWRRYLGSKVDETLLSVAPDEDGGYWVVMQSPGIISGDKTVDEPGSDDLWAVLLGANGEIVRQETRLWDRRFLGKVGGRSLFVEEVDERWKDREGFGETDLRIYQTDARGVIDHEILLGGKRSERLLDVAPAPNGGWLLLAETDQAVGGNMPKAQGGKDVWIIKLDRTGALEWHRTYGSSRGETLPNLTTRPDGGFILATYSRTGVSDTRKSPPAPGMLDLDLWVMGADAQGRPLWDFAIPVGPSFAIQKARDGGILLAAVVTGDGAARNAALMPSDDILFLKFAPHGIAPERFVPTLRHAPDHRAAGAWSFPTRPGYGYVVETSPTMRLDTWLSVLTIQGDGDEWTFPALAESRGATRQYFRLRTILPEPR